MPPKAKILRGRHGKWTVLGVAHVSEHGQYYYRCRCKCGTEAEVRGAAIIAGKSSGCTRCNSAHVTHGLTRGGIPPREYRVWAQMRERCSSPKNKSFHRYGGRGIAVCERWQGKDGYTNFLADMGPRPKDGSLDRIDNDGPYSPENCRWASRAEQNRNRSNNRNVTCAGRTLCASEWARVLQVDYRALHHFLKSGWTITKDRRGYSLRSPQKPI